MSQKQSYILLILAILLGFFLRLYNLDHVPLRGDEAFSALNWAQMPINQSLAEIATIEPHPLLTYVIFHIWNLIIGGIDSPFALRMLGVLGNLIGIPAMYALIISLMGRSARNIAVIAAFMFAIHPFEVWHSQDFRNYALWAGLSATTLWLGVRLNPRENDSTIDWALYGILATVTTFTFYTELLIIGALGLFMLLRYYRNRQFIFRFLALQTVIVVAVLFGFLVLQGDLLGGGGYGGNVEAFSAPDYLTRFIPTLVFGDTIPIELSQLWIPLCLMVFIGLVLLFYIKRSIGLLLMLLIFIPLILLGIASTRISIFHPRYVLVTVPAFISVLILGAFSFTHYFHKRIPIPRAGQVLILVSPWFIISAITLQNYFTNSDLRKAPAWDELGEFLNMNVDDDDLVIQLSLDPAFSYYYSGVADDRGLPASPIQPANEIVTLLDDLRTSYDSIYVVSNAIPDWQNADVVETWANENMQLVRLSNASGLGIRQYKNWDIDGTQFVEPLIQFDDVVELVGFEVFEKPLPTGEIALWLYWRPLTQTNISIKSFVHLVGGINPDTGSPLWAQDDQFPQNGRLDSALWQIGTVYRDVYYLPAESLLTGDYQILVGWYNPENNMRLFTNLDDDNYPLATISMP